HYQVDGCSQEQQRQRDGQDHGHTHHTRWRAGPGNGNCLALTMADDLVTIRLSSPAATPARAKAVYVETYGCQMNVADTDLMIGLLAERGFRACASAADADVILLNTCAVREKAEERVLARAAELAAWKRRRPGVVLGITGCMAEHLREKLLERAPYVDVVAGPDAYRRLPSLVEAAEDADDPLVDVRLDRNETYEGLGTAAGGDGV